MITIRVESSITINIQRGSASHFVKHTAAMEVDREDLIELKQQLDGMLELNKVSSAFDTLNELVSEAVWKSTEDDIETILKGKG